MVIWIYSGGSDTMKKAFTYMTLFILIGFISDLALKYSMSQEIENKCPKGDVQEEGLAHN